MRATKRSGSAGSSLSALGRPLSRPGKLSNVDAGFYPRHLHWSDIELRLFLCERDSAKRRIGGLHHVAFGFDEREDWLHAIDHVRSCGVEFVAGPYVHAHEGKDKGTEFTGGSGSHAFYFCDPDGNRIEFYCWMMNVTRASVATREVDL